MRAALLALALSAALSAAAPETPALKIAGETKYKPHSLVRLSAENADPKAGLLWRVYPVSVERATTARGVLEFTAPPGSYTVELLVITVRDDRSIDVAEARVVVVIEPCHPPEPPKPEPPRPGPGGGKLDPPAAIGRISFGRAGCSATVIGPRRGDGKWNVLTAAHCVEGQPQSGVMILKDGRRLGVHVVRAEYLPQADVCWLVTDQPHDDLPYAVVAADNPPAGTPVWHAGYGIDRPGNREDGVVMDPQGSSGKTRFVLNVSSGDSGGGIFRSDTNEVVSTVCCTAIRGAKTDMYGGSVRSIRRLMPQAADWLGEWPPAGGDEWAPLEIPFCRAP